MVSGSPWVPKAYFRPLRDQTTLGSWVFPLVYCHKQVELQKGHATPRHAWLRPETTTDNGSEQRKIDFLRNQ